jgi:hypothetical protein
VVDKQGLGHYKNNKVNGRVVVKGHEIPLWNKGGYLNTIMDIAHGVTTSTTTKDKPKVVNTTKGNGGVNVVTLDHKGKLVVKYVGACTMKAMRKSVWFQKSMPPRTQILLGT